MPLPLPPAPDPPVPPAVVRPFDPPREAWGTGHRGIDLALAPQAPVRSLSVGTVSFVGVIAHVPVLTVRMADGRRVTYQPVDAAVGVGARVGVGDVLGRIAPSGSHCGADPCLHVGLRRGEEYLDPAALLAPVAAVLKPRRS